MADTSFHDNPYEYHDSEYPVILAQLAADLFPIFVYIFLVILIGFLGGRLNILPTGRGRSVLASFLFNIALPAGIFLNMITIKVTGIPDPDYLKYLKNFVGCIMIEKSILYVLVLGVGLMIVRKSAVNWAIVSLFALATVHSNDYGIGQSILHILYDNSTIVPARHFPMYMDASIQLSYLTFIPLSVFLMELKRNRDLSLKWGKSFCYAFLRCLIRPIILAAILGLILRIALGVDRNASAHAVGDFMKWVGDRVLLSLINTIPPIYLIYTGLVLAGSVRQFITRREVMAIMAVTILKLGFSPLMMKLVGDKILPLPASNNTHTNTSLPVMLNLYGTLPTSPIVVIIASQYDLLPQIFAMIILMTTLAFAPIATFFLSLSYIHAADLFSKETAVVMDNVTKGTGWTTVALSLWVLTVLLFLQKYSKAVYRILLAQMACMTVYGALTAAIQIENIHNHMAKKSVAFGKAVAACMFCMLGCTNSFLIGAVDKGPTRAMEMLNSAKTWVWYVMLCVVMPVSVLGLTSLPKTDIKEKIEYDYMWDMCNNIDISFVITKLVVLVLSIVIGMLPMCFTCCTPQTMRRTLTRLRYEPILDESTDVSTAMRNYHRTKMGRTTSCAAQDSTCWELSAEDMLRFHATGIMTIIIAMVTLLVEAWSLFSNDNTKSAFVGFVILYQNLWLFVGLGMAVIFGSHITELRDQLVRLKEVIMEKVVKEGGEVSLPQMDSLPQETVLTCQRFVKYHLTACLSAIGKSIAGTFGNTYDNVFTGEEMVTWLINVGLAEERNEAEDYGRKLMLGRVVAHIDKRKLFYDRSDYLYRFVKISLHVRAGSLIDSSNAALTAGSVDDEFHVSTSTRAMPDWL